MNKMNNTQLLLVVILLIFCIMSQQQHQVYAGCRTSYDGCDSAAKCCSWLKCVRGFCRFKSFYEMIGADE